MSESLKERGREREGERKREREREREGGDPGEGNRCRANSVDLDSLDSLATLPYMARPCPGTHSHIHTLSLTDAHTLPHTYSHNTHTLSHTSCSNY